jgi:uncharacterized protein YigE (DUF2233 family)
MCEVLAASKPATAFNELADFIKSKLSSWNKIFLDKPIVAH